MKKVLFTSLVLFLKFNLSLGAQEITSPYQIIPELYPPKTLRVAFHVIHKDSLNDSTNIPDDSLANVWWTRRMDSINHYLANPAIPNYEFYKDYAIDSKIRIKNMGVYHHVDSVLWHNASIPRFYNTFVKASENFSVLEKDSVLHSFYYGDDKWGGMSGGIPTRRGMRFKGRWREFYHYRRYEPIGHRRNDGNYIHELSHCLGLYHNYKNSYGDQGTDCSGCDYRLGGLCFDVSTLPYAANNFMSKGGKAAPGNNSFTHCQLQRMLYYAYGYDKRVAGKVSDISMCGITESTCTKNYTTVSKDSSTLDYNFKAYGNIEIPNGFVFIVKSKLEMPAGSKIIIGPGAKLILDGGVISSNPDCQENWIGIENKKGSFWWWLYSSDKKKRNRPGEFIILNTGKLIDK